MDEQSSTTTPPRERGVEEWKPATQLSTPEIVSEARDLHAHFQQLEERYQQAPASQKAEIREEMAPLVNRERELREEYTGRIAPEISRDRVPEQSIGYGL
jgi:hypothetical protein